MRLWRRHQDPFTIRKLYCGQRLSTLWHFAVTTFLSWVSLPVAAWWGAGQPEDHSEGTGAHHRPVALRHRREWEPLLQGAWAGEELTPGQGEIVVTFVPILTPQPLQELPQGDSNCRRAFTCSYPATPSLLISVFPPLLPMPLPFIYYSFFYFFFPSVSFWHTFSIFFFHLLGVVKLFQCFFSQSFTNLLLYPVFPASHLFWTHSYSSTLFPQAVLFSSSYFDQTISECIFFTWRVNLLKRRVGWMESSLLMSLYALLTKCFHKIYIVCYILHGSVIECGRWLKDYFLLH